MKILAEKVIESEKITGALKGILSKKDKIRSNSFKVLLRISEKQPEILYPKYDYLANLLDSDNHYQRYISINILANLAVIDVKTNLKRYLINISVTSMATEQWQQDKQY